MRSHLSVTGILALAAAIFTTSASDVGICINLIKTQNWRGRCGQTPSQSQYYTIQYPFNLQGNAGKTDKCFRYACHTLILIFVCPAIELNQPLSVLFLEQSKNIVKVPVRYLSRNLHFC